MPASSGDLQFGSLRLSARERRLLHNGQEVPLTPKAFDTLQVLVSRAGHLVEKHDLMKVVWGEIFVDDSTLAQNIFTLRKALGNRAFIDTVPRHGYRFTAAVTPFDPSAVRSKPRSRAWVWITSAIAAVKHRATSAGSSP